MSANSVKIRIFWSASAFDLSSRMSFRSLSSCFGSNFRASSRNCTIWSRSRKASDIISSTSYSARSRCSTASSISWGTMSSSSSLLAFLAPELELALDGVAQDIGVLRLPALEALLLCVALAVNLDEGEQFLEEAVAGELEGGDGALEALEEVGPDEADSPVSGGSPRTGRCPCPVPCTNAGGSTSAA